MSAQLESRHFFRVRDRVQCDDGTAGEVVESWALYAVVRWADRRCEEIEQFDPTVFVVERAVP